MTPPHTPNHCGTRRSRDGSTPLEHERHSSQARPGNTNPQKRVTLPEWLDLTSPEGVRRFMRETLVPTAITGQLGVRVITALTSICKTLLDSQQAEILQALEERLQKLETGRVDNRTEDQILAAFTLSLPPGIQKEIREYAEQQAKLEGGV